MSKSKIKACIVGIDTGGTFTDFIWLSDGVLNAFKISSTPNAPAQAIIQGIARIERMGFSIERIVHGTTVATNALLERKGVPTAFITNHGLEDILLIGRQARKDIYALTPITQRQAIERKYCIGVQGRLSAGGEIIEDLGADQIESLVQTLRELPVEAVAVCLLFAYKNDVHERWLQEALRTHWFCSISSQVAAEQNEYERGVTTWLNSYLGPVMKDYLEELSLHGGAGEVLVMQSSGLTLPLSRSSDCAVRLLLSGPAGGYMAGRHICEQSAISNCITLDMGGTSTDVALISESEAITSAHQIAGFPISVPALDIHTVGAGGGSIAWLDQAGVLQLGPQSAGARPGPAAYQRGGQDATVTDANVMLGRIPVQFSRSQAFTLSADAASKAIEKLARQMGLGMIETAAGIVSLANETMLEALRVISVSKGHDPRSFALMCFGGAAALHVCDLAEALGVEKIVFPVFAGELSALGMLLANPGEEVSQSICVSLQHLTNNQIEAKIEELAQPIVRRLGRASAGIHQEVRLDLRYVGQTSTLTVPWQDIAHCAKVFKTAYSERFGHCFEDLAIELATIRIQIRSQAALRGLPEWPVMPTAQSVGETIDGMLNCDMPVFQREDFGRGQQINGPCIVLDEGSTLYVGSRWFGEVDRWGHIQLSERSLDRYN